MTHEEQIKWMADQITKLEDQYKSAMDTTAMLVGKMQPRRTWVGLTDVDIQQMGLKNYTKVVRETEAKLKELNS